MSKIALITGITGQDGSYLAELLLKKNYKIYGICKKSKKINFRNIEKIKKKIFIKKIDINNFSHIKRLIKKVRPNEFYHLAAQSFINYKFEDEFFKLNPNINGTHYILSAIKEFSPKTKFYFAGSSEMFGSVREVPQTEKTPFYPRSVYGISKVAGFDLTRNYREAYGLFCCSGILFNHESPRRGFEFVTRKITHAVARIKYGLQKDLKLGNMDAKRDWGHAEDYVKAMWMMLNRKTPEDFVISTGKQFSVRDFAKKAFKAVNLDYKKYIKIDKKLERPAEVQTLLGSCSKARRILKWKPKYNFQQLVNHMVKADLEFVKKNRY